MAHNHDLEQLLESLIKMVGRANEKVNSLETQIHQSNQKVDSLQMRVGQLEWIMKGQLKDKEIGPTRIYPMHSSEVHDKIPFHL